MSSQDWCCLTTEPLKDMADELHAFGPACVMRNYSKEQVELLVHKLRGCVSLGCGYHQLECDLDMLSEYLEDEQPDGPACHCRHFCKECV